MRLISPFILTMAWWHTRRVRRCQCCTGRAVVKRPPFRHERKSAAVQVAKLARARMLAVGTRPAGILRADSSAAEYETVSRIRNGCGFALPGSGEAKNDTVPPFRKRKRFPFSIQRGHQPRIGAVIDLVGQSNVCPMVDELHLTEQHQESEHAPDGYEFEWGAVVSHVRRSSVASTGNDAPRGVIKPPPNG